MWGSFWIRSIEIERPIQNACGTIHWARVSNWMRRRAGTSIYLPLLPDCGWLHVSNYFTFLLPWFPPWWICSLELRAKAGPSLLPEVAFVTAKGRVTKRRGGGIVCFLPTSFLRGIRFLWGTKGIKWMPLFLLATLSAKKPWGGSGKPQVGVIGNPKASYRTVNCSHSWHSCSIVSSDPSHC